MSLTLTMHLGDRLWLTLTSRGGVLHGAAPLPLHADIRRWRERGASLEEIAAELRESEPAAVVRVKREEIE